MGGPTLAVGSTTGPKGPLTRWWVGIGVGVVLALAASAIAFAVLRETHGEEVVRVRLVAADDGGPDPWVTGVAAGDVPGFQTTGLAAGGGAEVGSGQIDLTATIGTDDEVYGSASSERPVCDVEALATKLAADPEVGAAWAELVGVGTSEIPATLRAFAPVVLGGDVLVTNTGYRSGVPRRFPAVLQAGTAVLVDAYGRPRVKCGCGNPLLAADLPVGDDGSSRVPVEVEGEPWSGFAPEQVAVIQAAERPTASLRTVDLDSGEPQDTPVTEGPVVGSGFLHLTTSGVDVVSTDGEAVRVIDHEVADAWDDGAGGVVYEELRTTSEGVDRDVFVRTDNPPGGLEEGVILRIPAGGGAAEVLARADDSGWPVLLAAGRLGGRRVLVRLQVSAGSPARSGEVVVTDLDSGEERVVASFDGGFGGASMSDGYLGLTDDATTRLFGADLEPVSSGWCAGGCPGFQTVVGRGRLAEVEYSETGESATAVVVREAATGDEVASITDFYKAHLVLDDVQLVVDGAGDQLVISYAPSRTLVASAEDFEFDPAPATGVDLGAEGAASVELEPDVYHVLRAAVDVGP